MDHKFNVTFSKYIPHDALSMSIISAILNKMVSHFFGQTSLKTRNNFTFNNET